MELFESLLDEEARCADVHSHAAVTAFLAEHNAGVHINASLDALSNNYISLTYDTLLVLMKRNTEMALRLTPPDIYLNVSLGDYGFYDYDEAESIARLGREQMKGVLVGHII